MDRGFASSFVSVVPVGDVSQEICGTVAQEVTGTIGLVCTVSPETLDPRFSFDSKRKQYSSPALLESLRMRSVERAVRVLGLADVDLFMPVLTFVFGEAILGGGAAIVSIRRLWQSFYGLPENPALTRARAAREAVHELGHTLGLIHCPYYSCTMRSTRSVEEIDLASGGLCGPCRRQIAIVVGGLLGSDQEPAHRSSTQ
ncbi:MAG: hypothetical protein HY815_27210 [Candidatus Riflebacteria bacterium]|nr:hypothetical protein [Candidatus Riflebacteria bacterium]